MTERRSQSSQDEIFSSEDLAVVGTVDDAIIEILRDDEQAYDYLALDFFASSIQCLVDARQRAGLSQKDIAEKMSTKQSAIARWEADQSGAISLANYCRFARAVGVMPFQIELGDIERVRHFAIEHPTQSVTASAFGDWEQLTLALFDGPGETISTTVTDVPSVDAPQETRGSRIAPTRRGIYSDVGVYAPALASMRQAGEAIGGEMPSSSWEMFNQDVLRSSYYLNFEQQIDDYVKKFSATEALPPAQVAASSAATAVRFAVEDERLYHQSHNRNAAPASRRERPHPRVEQEQDGVLSGTQVERAA